jgi:hypothetical protein
MSRSWLLSIVVFLMSLSLAGAQPVPRTPLPNSPFHGQWFFKGDRSKPAFIQSVATKRGEEMRLTNENGTAVMGAVRNGRIVVPAWNITGTPRQGGKVIVWSNGDSWTR